MSVFRSSHGEPQVMRAEAAAEHGDLLGSWIVDGEKAAAVVDGELLGGWVDSVRS
jgi:hypothetical protein